MKKVEDCNVNLVVDEIEKKEEAKPRMEMQERGVMEGGRREAVRE